MRHAIEIRGARCVLRPYRASDAERLAALAGSFDVARWMTAGFPHPYVRAAADDWIRRALAHESADHFAIEAQGELIGGIGIEPATGELRGSAEFGYWIGRDFWGRGIASEAASLAVAHAFGRRGLRRLQAHVFAPNVASSRVLEKLGFRREGLLRQAYTERDGTIVDGVIFARLSSDAAPSTPFDRGA